MKKIVYMAIVAVALFSTPALAKDFKGSIKMGWFESEHKAMKEVKINMIQALQVAQKEVPGRIIKAKLEEEDGYLIYDIKIVTPEGKKVKLYIDPVTAKVLYKDKEYF